MVSFRVVIPTHNRAGTVGTAVESVLGQTHQALTVVVVDDGSEDDTLTRLASFQDPRLQILRQRNLGASAARNAGAEGMSEDYVTFLDSDDTVDQDWLATLAQATEFRPRPAVITCGFRVRQPDGSTEAVLPVPTDFWPKVRGIFGHAGTFALRRDVFELVGGYRPDLPGSENTELSYRVLKVADWTSVATVDLPLMTYHVGSPNSLRDDDLAVARGAMLKLRQHQDLFASNRKARADVRGVAGVRLIRAGHVSLGRRFLLESLLAEPTSMRRWIRLIVGISPLGRRRWQPTRATTH